MSHLKQQAIEIWQAGVAAVHGRTLVESAVSAGPQAIQLGPHRVALADFDRILVVGGGKFSHLMATGLERKLGDELSQQKQLSGLVTVPDGSELDLKFVMALPCRPPGVNLPTPRVLDATEQMMELLRGADDRTLVVALISGGGSALIEHSPLPLEDIVAATHWLSSQGANIIELNSVRVAISDVKGGALAGLANPARLIGLIVSDVPGDDIRFVSSGPTVPFGENPALKAIEVLERFNVAAASEFPQSVVQHVQQRAQMKFEASEESRIENVLVGDASVALKAAMERARGMGFEVATKDPLADAANCQQVGEAAAEWCQQNGGSAICGVSIGEPTATPGPDAGQGGRNQHAVLVAINTLLSEVNFGETDFGEFEFCFLSGGTDGEDGNTTAAGGIFTSQELASLAGDKRQIGQAAQAAAGFDSHTFLTQAGMTFESGPTQTNVCDLRVLLWRRKNAN